MSVKIEPAALVEAIENKAALISAGINLAELGRPFEFSISLDVYSESAEPRFFHVTVATTSREVAVFTNASNENPILIFDINEEQMKRIGTKVASVVKESSMTEPALQDAIVASLLN